VGELFRKLSKASEDENFDENYPKKMVEKDIENLRTLYMNIMYLEINLQIVEKFIMYRLKNIRNMSIFIYILLNKCSSITSIVWPPFFRCSAVSKSSSGALPLLILASKPTL
jgi:hypothetical protein